MTPVVPRAVQPRWCASAGLHGAGEDEELADEAGEHGQAYGGERGEDEHGDDPGELCGETAELAWRRDVDTGDFCWHARYTRGDKTRTNWIALDPSIGEGDVARAKASAASLVGTAKSTRKDGKGETVATTACDGSRIASAGSRPWLMTAPAFGCTFSADSWRARSAIGSRAMTSSSVCATTSTGRSPGGTSRGSPPRASGRTCPACAPTW